MIKWFCVVNHISPGVLPPDNDARPQDLQAAFWEQTPQVTHASRACGRQGIGEQQAGVPCPSDG